MRQEHAIQGIGGARDSEAKVSMISYLSGASGASKVSKASIERFKEMKKARQAAKMPTLNEQEVEDELEAKPEDFLCCNVCGKHLTQDEKIINARFVNEAMSNNGDITIFPVCIKCNFDNLLINSKMVREKKLGLVNEEKPAFFPSNKKLYDENLHQNSEEFK